MLTIKMRAVGRWGRSPVIFFLMSVAAADPRPAAPGPDTRTAKVCGPQTVVAENRQRGFR